MENRRPVLDNLRAGARPSTPRELGLSHVTLHAILRPVIFLVVGADPGRPNVGALVPALPTWSREDATSSLVTGSPDPLGNLLFSSVSSRSASARFGSQPVL